MSLRTKWTLLLAGVFVALGAAIVTTELRLLNRVMVHGAEDRVQQSIKTAWSLLQANQARIAAALRLVALDPGARLDAAARRAGMDGLIVLGPDGRIERTSFGGLPGPEASLFAAPSGFALLRGPLAGMLRSGADALLATYAGVAAGQGRLIGLDVLDGRDQLVDAIAAALFPPTVVDGHPVGTVTIFRGAQRVATTVRLPDGKRAVGTAAAPDVSEQVLDQLHPWTGRAWVLDTWYVARYEPLLGANGVAIGMLYVGELELPFLVARRRLLIRSLVLVLGIIVLASLIFAAAERRLLRQIVDVHQATVRLKGGDAGVRSRVHTRDELGDLARAFNDMADELGRQRRELIAQRDRAESANRGYLETLGFVSHELRNALGTAVFNAEALRDGTYGALGADQQEGLGLVRQSLGYMADVMNHYLQLSRIEHGELLLKKVPVALARDVIRPAVAPLEPQLRERNMRLEIAVAEEVDVLADPSLLRVVYENLLDNACKYGVTGGLVRAGAVRQGGRVTLDVWNEGPGVAPEQLPQIFHKFQRLEGATGTSKRGTGLGLYIARQIVLQHGGEMGAESEPGRWIRIWFSLEPSSPPAL